MTRTTFLLTHAKCLVYLQGRSGTPVASHGNFKNQMPEAEAIINGENGFLFEENNSADLANKIDIWFLNNSNIDKDLIRRIIIKKYNPENQMHIFEKMFSNG